MEVCEGPAAADESDMGVPDPDAVLAVCSSRGNSSIAMEGSEHVCIGNAKVRALSADKLPRL